MDLTVRPVELVDAEQVLAILNPVIAEGRYSVFDKQLTIETERDYIRNLPNRGTFLPPSPC